MASSSAPAAMNQCAALRNEDALYCVVERTINGQQRRYIERMQSRLYDVMDDAFFVDCGLTYDGRNRDASKTMTMTGGTGDWPYYEDMTLTVAGASYFTAGDIGSEIHMSYVEEDVSKVLKLQINAVVNGNGQP